MKSIVYSHDIENEVVNLEKTNMKRIAIRKVFTKNSKIEKSHSTHVKIIINTRSNKMIK